MWYKGAHPNPWVLKAIAAAVYSIAPEAKLNDIAGIVRGFWDDKNEIEADTSGGMRAFLESDHWGVMNEVRDETAKRAHFFAGGGTRRELKEGSAKRAEWDHFLRTVLRVDPMLIFNALCRTCKLQIQTESIDN
jgi:hypothetical protein